MTALDFFRAHRVRLVILAVTFVMAVLWLGIVIMKPLPPRSLAMVTGPEGGAYHEIGKQYRRILARDGVDLRLQPTKGALENLTQLGNPLSGVSVGFVQGGITSEQDSSDLVSLGTVFYEPLWLFHRGVAWGKGLESLRGRRISVGTEGSGTQALSLELLARNGVDKRFATLLALAPEDAAEKLLQGEIDAVFMISSWNAPVLHRLLTDKDTELASLPRADAYVALYPYLNKVVVPAGAGDLAKNQPSADAVLIAPKASLVVRGDLHPAIQYLLLDAAWQVHSRPGIFQKAGQFPAAEAIDFSLSPEARQFYRSGRPFLQRQLPFWMAALITRLLVLLIPLIGALYPLFRFLPLLYGWQMRRRVYKLYDELRLIEHGVKAPGMQDLTSQLERLEEKANGLQLSVSYMGMLYVLREHIALVRERLRNPRE